MERDKKNIEKFINEALAIEAEEAKNAGALGYMARALVQATMPHNNPGNIDVWGRQNGNFSITIRAGYELTKENKPQSVGLPYGSIPRLLIAWITTEAVKTKNKNLILGNTLSEFMRELDLIPTGGRWGSITRLRTQMTKLFSAAISCTYDDGEHWAIKNVQLISSADLWWEPKQPNQATLWESTLILGQEFFDEIIDAPIPIDMRALKALKQSSMAIDIYCWLTYRMSYLKHKTKIPWVLLQMQFGANYKDVRQFRRRFLEQLRKVFTVYGNLKIDYDQNCFKLLPSKPHILLRSRSSCG
jgi:hypothetical protein